MTAQIIPFRPRRKTVAQSYAEFWIAVWVAGLKFWRIW